MDHAQRVGSTADPLSRTFGILAKTLLGAGIVLGELLVFRPFDERLPSVYALVLVAATIALGLEIVGFTRAGRRDRRERRLSRQERRAAMRALARDTRDYGSGGNHSLRRQRALAGARASLR